MADPSSVARLSMTLLSVCRQNGQCMPPDSSPDSESRVFYANLTL